MADKRVVETQNSLTVEADDEGLWESMEGNEMVRYGDPDIEGVYVSCLVTPCGDVRLTPSQMTVRRATYRAGKKGINAEKVVERIKVMLRECAEAAKKWDDKLNEQRTAEQKVADSYFAIGVNPYDDDFWYFNEPVRAVSGRVHVEFDMPPDDPRLGLLMRFLKDGGFIKVGENPD